MGVGSQHTHDTFCPHVTNAKVELQVSPCRQISPCEHADTCGLKNLGENGSRAEVSSNLQEETETNRKVASDRLLLLLGTLENNALTVFLVR